MANERQEQAHTAKRGFAAMDRQRQREIASLGGRAAHEKGTAHEFDSNEARAAGRKGGEAVSQNREHMAAIGRRGGEARGAALHAAAARNGHGSNNGGGGGRDPSQHNEPMAASGADHSSY